eukprot:scaffold281_cov318-Pavlova_lutheri.AAC.19
MDPSTEERVKRSNAGETAGKAAFWLLAVAGLRKASAKTAFLNGKEREAFENVVTKEENLCHGFRTLRGSQLEEVLESLCLSPSVVEKLKEPLLQQKLSTQLVHHALSDHAEESQVRVIVQFLCNIQAYDCVPSMLEIVLEYKDALASAGLDAGRPNFFIAELCRQIPVFLKGAFFDTLVKMHGSGTQAMAESMIAELYRLNDWGTCKLVGELVLLSFDFFQATAMPLCEWASDRMGSIYQQPAVAYLLDGLVLHKYSEIGNTAMQLLRHWASTIDSSGVATSLKLLIVSGLARLLPMPKDVELVQSILQLIVKASVCWPEDTRCPLVHPLLDCIMDSLKASSTTHGSVSNHRPPRGAIVVDWTRPAPVVRTRYSALRRRRVVMGSGQSRTDKRTITDVDRAVLALKTQKRKLGEYQKRVEGAIEREERRAKELVQGKKNQQALLALKKRKLHQQQLEKVCAWVLNVEESIVNIEQSQVQNDVYLNLKRGNDALQILQKEVPIDDVDEIIKDTSESAAHWEEINKALSDQLDPTQLQEVDEELQQMENAMLDEDLSTLPSAPRVVQKQQPQAESQTQQKPPKQKVGNKEAVAVPS